MKLSLLIIIPRPSALHSHNNTARVGRIVIIQTEYEISTKLGWLITHTGSDVLDNSFVLTVPRRPPITARQQDNGVSR